MPPPKAKLHKKTGKLKNIQSNSPNNLPNRITSTPLNNTTNMTQHSLISSSTSQQVNTNEGDSDADRQFEVELTWCVQQIQSSLNTGKLSEKQTIDSEKVLKILKSSNQPIIKKRQIMKSTFGDYRIKMLHEEKKMSLKAKQIKFNSNNATNEKSYFLKKSAFTTSGSNFKFNFPIEEQIEKLNISNGNEEKLKETSNKETEFYFHPSNNSFKFNFEVNELEEFTAL